MVLTVLFLYANVFMFILFQNVSFQEGVSEVNQRDIDRISEKITVSDVNYTVVEDQVYVAAQVTNDGPVSVQMITLWVVDKTTQKYGYNDTLSINLKTGDTLIFAGSNALGVTIEDSSSSNVFTSWFVTDRGNFIPLENEQGIIVAQLAQGIGSLALDLYKFRYFTYVSDQKLGNYPNGNIGFDVPKNNYVAFGCHLTNLDPSKQTITIDSHSLFWQPGRGGVSDKSWFIVNVNEDGTINGAFSSISLKYGETKMIVFASDNDLAIGSFKRLNTPNAQTTVATFLLLHGTIGSTAYAQNIPFVSLFYY